MRVRDLEEMFGVVGRGRACRQHAIVTRKLALEAQPLHRPPDTRVEPIQRAHDGGTRLRQAITPLDVRELVLEGTEQGVFVSRVHPASAAEKAGVKPGDRVALGLTSFSVLPNYTLAR